MKRILAVLLGAAMLLTGCMHSQSTEPTSASASEVSSEVVVLKDEIPQYKSLDDPELLAYMEDLIYQDTVLSLNSDEYFVENVSTTYISKEYLDEVTFNSQSNIYFGYTLAELDEIFQGTRYIFTLGEDGQTEVQELQELEDTSVIPVLKNVAVGTGVILVCVTVSNVAAVAGAPAVSLIFAVSAISAKSMAVSSAAFGGISAGIVRGIQTGDFDEALEAAVFAGSEGFKWGAITGGILGGAGETFALKSITESGLTMNEAALIQMDSTLPLDVIAQFHSLDEYLVYKKASLKPVMVNGRTALLQNIDLDFVSKLPDGRKVTNLMRMQEGYPPLEPLTEKPYQLHHIGQKADGTLAVLTEAQHQRNAAILNIPGKASEIVRTEFAETRREFWKYCGTFIFSSGGI